jgi:hypothetical protein
MCESEIQLKTRIVFQVPRIKTAEDTLQHTPGLVLVGFRHDHKELLRYGARRSL